VITAGRGRVPTSLSPWLGAVLISFSGVWVRLADVEAVRSAFLRGAYALPLLAVLVAVRARSDGDGRRWFRPVAFVAGLFLGLDLITWHASMGIIGAGLGTVLPNLQVVFVGLIGVAVFHERPARTFWIALPAVLAGIWLLAVVGRPVTVDGPVAAGVALGVLTAVLYSIALVMLRLSRSRSGSSSAVGVLWSLTLGATATTGVAAVIDGVAGPAGWPADGYLVLLAIGSQVLGWLLLTTSIHRLPAAATSVALLLQPVLALVWGGLLLAEPVGLPQASGAAVVLVGVALAHRSLREVAVRPTPDATARIDERPGPAARPR